MCSPHPKVWSPEIENVKSKILRSLSVMMTIDASPAFRSKGHGLLCVVIVITIVIGGDNVPPPLTRSGRDNGDKKIQFIPLFLYINQVLVYLFASLASFGDWPPRY